MLKQPALHGSADGTDDVVMRFANQPTQILRDKVVLETIALADDFCSDLR